MIIFLAFAVLTAASLPLLFLLVLQSLLELWREWWRLMKRLPRLGW